MANQVSAKSIKSNGFVYVAVCVLRLDTGEWVASGVAALRKCLHTVVHPVRTHAFPGLQSGQTQQHLYVSSISYR